MKTTVYSFLFFLLSFTLISCGNDDTPEPVIPLEATLIQDLAAPNDVIDRTTGQVTQARPFVFFSLETQAIVSESQDWDIAFKGTTIRVNSSKNVTAALANGIFEELKEVPASAQFATDTPTTFAIPTGSGAGWYNYNSATFTVTPIPGRILLFRTSKGNYVKMEILSYYQGNPPVAQINPMTTPSAHLQPNGSQKF
ncbi:MAG: HmuY family protein [Algoriphagus sp.]|nr:HmuY family protein [Algoriphagus sp.]